MSTDPEAIIYYGFPLEDFEDEDYSYHEKNDEWGEAKRPKQPEDKGDYKSPEWDVWREQMAVWEKSPENIEIEWSGAEGCEAYYVHASGMKHSVEWDEQKPLAGVSFEPQTEADEQLRRFCEKFGIEWKQPGWHLAARYF